MKHFILLYFLLTFALGFGSLFIYILITIKTKSKLLIHILVFYIAFTLSVFYQMYMQYINENYSYILSSYNYIHYVINISIQSFLDFSVPFFVAYISKFKWKNLQNILLGIIISLFFVLQLFINIKDKYNYLGIAIITVTIYSIIIGIIGYIRISDKILKNLLRNICIVAIIFLPGLIYNEYPIFKFNITVSPLLYSSFCIVFILFVIKIYFRDYYISEQEIEALKDGKIFHKESNIFNKYELSDREREVAICVLEGYSNKKISDELFISLSTVKTHIHNTFKKTGCTNRYELIHLVKFS